MVGLGVPGLCGKCSTAVPSMIGLIGGGEVRMSKVFLEEMIVFFGEAEENGSKKIKKNIFSRNLW